MVPRPSETVDRAARFEPQELFFSTTDIHGRITACNDVFLRIAAYPPAEVIGAAHSLVRHPDMPRTVFRVLWDHLLDGQPVAAYVKNLTSAGEYYWVYALAMPIEGGFLSLRLKPLSGRLDVVGPLYARLCALEQDVLERGGRKDEGIQAGLEALDAAVRDLGHANYEDFMAVSLRAEIAARNTACGAAVATSPFDDLALFDQLATEASAQAQHFADVGVTTHRIALNSAISAARLGEVGAALGVLSEQIARLSSEIAAQSNELDAARLALVPVFQELSYQVAFATLVRETGAAFRAKAASCRLDESEQRATYGASLEELSVTLELVLDQSLARTREGVGAMAVSLRRFDEVSERFRRVLLTTRISHVTGRAMAAQLAGASETSALLDEMAEGAESARARLERLQFATRCVRNAVRRWRLERVDTARRAA